MSINFETATREELLAYIEQQKLVNKKVNKTDKLLVDLQQLFNTYSDNSTDKLLWLHYCLSILFCNLSIPINEHLEQLDYEPDEENLLKVVKVQVKEVAKTDDCKLRKSKKNNVTTVNELVENKEISTPL